MSAAGRPPAAAGFSGLFEEGREAGGREGGSGADREGGVVTAIQGGGDGGQDAQAERAAQSDAVRVIVGYGFREMGLHRIELGVFPFNPAGIRAYEKAGFTEEGRRREAVLHDGRWYDDILMSVLDREWAARRKPRTTTQNVPAWPAARVDQTDPNVEQNRGYRCSG